jgi:hypothetical protein
MNTACQDEVKRRRDARGFFSRGATPIPFQRNGGNFGLRWQLAEAKRSEDWSLAATALWTRLLEAIGWFKAASRSACRRSPKAVDRLTLPFGQQFDLKIRLTPRRRSATLQKNHG